MFYFGLGCGRHGLYQRVVVLYRGCVNAMPVLLFMCIYGITAPPDPSILSFPSYSYGYSLRGIIVLIRVFEHLAQIVARHLLVVEF